jgi:glutaredoxin
MAKNLLELKGIEFEDRNTFYCQMAKNLLELKGIEFEERNTSLNKWSREDMLSAVPEAKTFPQIFIDDEYIGGFTELQKYLKES